MTDELPGHLSFIMLVKVPIGVKFALVQIADTAVAVRKSRPWSANVRRRLVSSNRPAGPMADQAARQQDPSIPADQTIVPCWSPNRLRHNRATELRPFGLDVAKTVLGHAKVETTQIDAEKDMHAAMKLVAKIG
jgi:site-specific recombinase XerD